MGRHSNQVENINAGEIVKEVATEEKEEREENLIQSKVMEECPNKPINPNGRDGFVVIKVPVILAEFEVEINSELRAKFDQPAVEILRVKKNAFLTECRLLPKVKKLFIKGFIRKRIEYAAKQKEGKGGNNVRQIIVCATFTCATTVDYAVEPVIDAEVVKCKSNKDISDLVKEDSRDTKKGDYEYFNEKIYCEIVKARIFEEPVTDEKKKEESSHESVIREINEKLVIYLTLKLLQKQEINIYGASPKYQTEKKNEKRDSSTQINSYFMARDCSLN